MPEPLSPNTTAPLGRLHATRGGLRVWHLALLVLFVAIAIVNIQDQRATEPVMIALAIAGFVLYGVLGWLGWRFARRFQARYASVAVLSVYLTAMAALFLVATALYVWIDVNVPR